MKRYLLGLFIILTTSVSLFAQVKLYDSGVTKFYDNGTRITYFEMTGFPNSAEMRSFVERIVLEIPDINRAAIYTDGVTFMYEALQSVDPDMVVDAVNDALAEYIAQVGDFPPNDPPSMSKPKSNVIVTPHKAASSAQTQPVGTINQEFVVNEEKSASKGTDLKAVPADKVRRAAKVERNESDSKRIEVVFPDKYNKNIKNK